MSTCLPISEIYTEIYFNIYRMSRIIHAILACRVVLHIDHHGRQAMNTTEHSLPPNTPIAAAGHKCRAIEAGPPVPMMIIMPLGQVTDKNRLVARRRAMAMDLEDEGCEAIERKQTRLAFV